MENVITLKGIQYIVDETGKRKAVVIDLDQWGELWEDFYDIVIAEERKHETNVDWNTLKAELET